jgi:hypothetical protein
VVCFSILKFSSVSNRGNIEKSLRASGTHYISELISSMYLQVVSKRIIDFG